MSAANEQIRIRRLGLTEYTLSASAMQSFNSARQHDTLDEIWLLQHPPVYTLGRTCRQTLHRPDDRIPIIDTDRGGQMTYHGPGQLIAYVLIELKRRGLGIKHLVTMLEQSIIDLLAEHGLNASRKQDAPGVYVEGRKIAALGLRVRSRGSTHGLSFNVDMDLAPFANIDPCGYSGLVTTSLANEGVRADLDQTQEALIRHLCIQLGYNDIIDGPCELPSLEPVPDD